MIYFDNLLFGLVVETMVAKSRGRGFKSHRDQKLIFSKFFKFYLFSKFKKKF